MSTEDTNAQFVNAVETAPRRVSTVSLRASIMVPVLLAMLPAFLLATYLAYENYVLSRERATNQALMLARSLSARLDQEFSAIESGLRVLATSEELAEGNFKKFHQRAAEAVPTQIVYNYILTDSDGRQLVNTVRPYGSPLPNAGTPKQLAAVFTENRTVLTDLFEGPVVRRPVIAMGVPVHVGDTVRYSLNVGLEPKALSKLLMETEIPSQWLAAALDSTATIVARTRNAEDYIGQKAVPAVAQKAISSDESTFEATSKEGIPVITALHRSKKWNWVVAVGVEKAVLEAELNRNLRNLAVVGVITVGLAWGLALLMTSRLVRSLQALNRAARELAHGEAREFPAVEFQETQDIAQALRLASETLRDSRYRASHDALTGLANRAMFDDLANNQISRSRREQTSYAVLAIDLDNFKNVNDSQGHAVGDAVLREVARRLAASVREFDIAARLGGDEFLVLLAPADAVLAQEVSQRIIDALSKPYEGTSVAVSASIGIALFPAHASSNDQLQKLADQALYRAKREGRARAVLWEP